MAEGGNNDPADLDAVSIQSDASTEILYIPEGQVVPVVDLITPSTTPDSSVHFVSPSGSSCSDLIDSDGESICDPPMLDESDYNNTNMELSTSDEDMPQLFFEGRVFTESRDTFGSPIWIDRLDLNCYAQGARGTPRGSLTCKSHNVLRDAHCRRIEGVCGVAPGGEHDHRDPVAAEIRYLRVRYLARVFCCEERSAVGLTAYLGGLVDIYRLPWTPRALMRSMMDMAATCVRTGRIWPHVLPWADPESPERALHYGRLRAAQGRRDARIAMQGQWEQLGNGAQFNEETNDEIEISVHFRLCRVIF
ncbi:Uncharacterized protein APZ42_019103 [Daphnia magna]|uniref:Uncharacterized protein n=1 Tax=Daphnia magna TaxID=35525 RepID=A0A164YNG4_9CRUS|nr:Uncharacterized protein APZ42_019103 [Daphnia magna]